VAQVARAFNRIYNLRLSTRGEMQAAFEGERLTPSLCGKMDQVRAWGRAVPLRAARARSARRAAALCRAEVHATGGVAAHTERRPVVRRQVGGAAACVSTRAFPFMCTTKSL